MVKPDRRSRRLVALAAAGLIFAAVPGLAPVAAAAWLMRSGAVEIVDRSLVMGLSLKNRNLTAEESRRKAEEQMRRLRERLVLAVAAERAGIAQAPAVVAAIEEFRFNHLVDLFLEEKVVRGALQAAKEAAAGDAWLERKTYPRERAQRYDELYKTAVTEFPAEIDKAALAATAAGGEGNPVVGKVLGREVRADEVRRGMAGVSHPSNRKESDEGVALSVLDSLLTKIRFAALAERAGFAQRPDFVGDLADRRLRLLADAYAEQVVYPGVQPTAAEIETFYAANAERLRRGEEREIFEILVAEKADAEAIAARLAAGGDFAKEVREQSTGPTREMGGRLGFLRPGEILPALDAALQKLQAGGVSSPVKSTYGWHILRCAQVVTGRVPPLEEVRAALEIQVRDEQRAKALTAAAARLAPEVPVEFNDTRYQEILKGL